MAKPGRSNDWGFPRWRSYGSSREAESVRLCDRHGCSEPGDRPAPKSPNSRDRWYFCETHAAEYNRRWNYFEGLSTDEAARRLSTHGRNVIQRREEDGRNAVSRETRLIAGNAPKRVARIRWTRARYRNG